MLHDCRRKRHANRQAPILLESLEERTLLSTSHAVMVLDAPRTADQPLIQVDQSATPSPTHPGSTMTSALDLQVRIVAGGIYLNVAASSQVFTELTPTGTIDFYDETDYLGTVELGGVFRNTVVLPPGLRTFFATYNGDVNFLPSQTSVTTYVPVATNTLPASSADYNVFATNDSGQRIRPMRMLSLVNFFDSASMSVGAIPPIPVPVGAEDPLVVAGAEPGSPLPVPRFSKITFSVRVPRVTL